MPDSRMPDHEARNWSDAFAALPLETPPRDAWTQVAAEIRASSASRVARNRRPWWTAVAAALALAIAVPLARMPDKTPQPAPTRSPDAAQHDAPQQPQTGHPGLSAAGQTPDVQPSTAEKHPNQQAAAGNRSIAKKTPAKPAPGEVQTTPPAETRLAQAKQPESVQPAGNTASLDTLYAQSAQLEALVAQTRDESFATGPAAVLADELESRVALIDASLTQPELAAVQRTALWQERVDALRQLAGFQSAQRLLAAQGERYDGQLVAVY